MRAAVMLAVMAVPAFAQGYPHFSAEADTLGLVRQSDDLAILTYHNSADMNSLPLETDLSDGGLTVRAVIQIGSGPETLTVHAPEGWVAVPWSIDVADGDSVDVQIFRAAPGM